VLLAQALFGNPEILLLDEPTNNLDVDSVQWLIQFLANFENTVIVVSHDRHFLDEVCTYVADIDFSKIKLFAGNYTFWYQSSQLAQKQRTEQNKKVEEKRKELEEFIRRFSANVAKSKQATSRAKLLEKLTIDDIQPSSRKYPYIAFKPERDLGDQILNVENLSATSAEGNVLFSNISFSLLKGEKVAFLSKDTLAVTTFFQVLANEIKPTQGEFKWGVTTNVGFFPHDNSPYFKEDLNLVDWLRQYSVEKDESFIRGFLGRMLFSGEESLKSATVLSGGEKVRCMMSKLMLQSPNILMLDEPTDHLDLESITSLNNSLVDFKGVLLLKTRDFEILNTVCSRIIEITPNGAIDKYLTYEEYISSPQVKALREEMYAQAV
jgi:ATPase subunit of ABC transporter with duplicated ATPase domains